MFYPIFEYRSKNLTDSRNNFLFHTKITLTLSFLRLYYHDVGNSCSITDVVGVIFIESSLCLKTMIFSGSMG